MLNRDEAEQLARRALESVGAPPIAFIPEEVIERPFGWIFFAESNPGERSPARCPMLLVDRHTSKVFLTTTGFFVQNCVEVYEAIIHEKGTASALRFGFGHDDDSVFERLFEEVGLCEIWPSPAPTIADRRRRGEIIL